MTVVLADMSKAHVWVEFKEHDKFQEHDNTAWKCPKMIAYIQSMVYLHICVPCVGKVGMQMLSVEAEVGPGWQGVQKNNPFQRH